MLINCPECELQVSDKAPSCPHCGYPLIKISIKNTTNTSRKKHQRLPNGFGRITKLSGKNLRAPYRAMVTIGKDEFGKPIGKLLKPNAYFKTYNEAYAALIEYNKNPYDFDTDMTFKEVYDKWSSEYFKELANCTQANIKSAWTHCRPLYDADIKSIRTSDIKKLLADMQQTEIMAKKIKILIGQIFKYAIENEIVTRNPTDFKLTSDLYANKDKEKRDAHITFSNEEIERIMSNIGTVVACDMIIIQCYMGWRPKELLNIKLQDINFDNWTITGGMKTESGKNRIVPIHTKIRSLIQKRYDEANKNGCEYLFMAYEYFEKSNTMKATPYNYYRYRRQFKNMKVQLNLDANHNLHDCRKHFISKAKEYNMNEYALKRIVGHSISDITEYIYTERSPQWLSSEMEKIEKI